MDRRAGRRHTRAPDTGGDQGNSAMEQDVRFDSNGLTLSGTIHRPRDLSAGETRPAFLILHGFGGSKNNIGSRVAARLFADLGYVTMRFSMRGCGDSEGEPARVICLEQVDDTKAALDYMASRPEVDDTRIGAVGSSFGAAVAVYAAGVDRRIAAVISSGG